MELATSDNEESSESKLLKKNTSVKYQFRGSRSHRCSLVIEDDYAKKLKWSSLKIAKSHGCVDSAKDADSRKKNSSNGKISSPKSPISKTEQVKHCILCVAEYTLQSAKMRECQTSCLLMLT
ncbi:hypothetical protein M8J76_006274 [Diaphorina citri]|nr:hypothetical protein M8J76_006274 [Diaphorina citri]KAI5755015.1 hypothetical protein M8J77_013412 [Diaphorina citri]